MKKTVFTGAATAIITPFKNGQIDYESFEKLINWQIDEGIDAIVVCCPSFANQAWQNSAPFPTS